MYLNVLLIFDNLRKVICPAREGYKQTQKQLYETIDYIGGHGHRIYVPWSLGNGFRESWW